MNKIVRKFNRPIAERYYRRMFIIVVEGRKTEPEYFNLFNSHKIINIKCISGNNKSAPEYLLSKMNDYIKKNGFREGDEAWIVVDRDSWKEEHLDKLYNWAKTKENYDVALSNPKFEYWLLLHFEEGNKIISSKDCDMRLKNFLPNYNKNINSQYFAQENITKAVERAKLRDNQLNSSTWPKNMGTSTVYKLVEKILIP